MKAFDVYMVDGRYRVACACIAFLHAMKYGGNMNRVRVLVHDNDETFRGYTVVEKEIGDVVIRNAKLWAYKLKTNVTERDIFNLWRNFESKTM